MGMRALPQLFVHDGLCDCDCACAYVFALWALSALLLQPSSPEP